MTTGLVTLWIVALLGHMWIWIRAVDHLHATSWPKWLVGLATHTFYGWMWCALPLLYYWLWVWPLWPWFGQGPATMWAARTYLAVAGLAAMMHLPIWLTRRLRPTERGTLVSNHGQAHDLDVRAGQFVGTGIIGRTVLALPYNESLRLEVNEKQLRIPRLPPALDGLTVLHLSDLHFTGRIKKGYFQECVRLAAEQPHDLVALTGDLIDTPACVSWLVDVLGQFRARFGAYFVLGNHDSWFETAPIRAELIRARMTDLGGKSLTAQVRGLPLFLAGNELPWMGKPPDLTQSDAQDPAGPLRILLSHSPDQYGWARRAGFDLMLAGHTHGGQVQFPLLGPIVAPSHHGVRYASGTFFEPPTVMHVSRGLSGRLPLRFRCLPEIARLVLRADGVSPP